SPHLYRQEAMIAGGAVGEIGYSFSPNIDRDPLKSALLLLSICEKRERPLSQLVQELHEQYGTSHYKQWTVASAGIAIEPFGLEMVEKIGHTVKEILTFDGYQFLIDEIARILIRPATTEGGLRIYAEVHRPDQLETLYTFIREKTGCIPEEKA